MGYLERGMAEDALPHLERALELDPDHVASMLPAAQIYLEVGRPDTALRLARRVVERQPLNAKANFLAGLSCEALGQRAQAIAFFERAFSLSPQDSNVRKTLDRVRSQSPPRSG